MTFTIARARGAASPMALAAALALPAAPAFAQVADPVFEYVFDTDSGDLSAFTEGGNLLRSGDGDTFLGTPLQVRRNGATTEFVFNGD